MAKQSGRPTSLFELDAAFEQAGGTGHYLWRVAEDRLIWSSGLLAIYGITEAPADEGGFSRLLHPDDRVRVEAETSGYLSSHRTTFSHLFHIVRPDGVIRFLLDRGVIERDLAGRAVTMRGVNVDLTDLPQTHPGPSVEMPIQGLAELTALYAEAPLGLGLLDQEFRFVRINPALAEMNGFPVEEHLGRSAWELLPSLRETAEPAMQKVMATGQALRDVLITGETPARPGEQRSWREHFYPLRGTNDIVQGIGIICEEITEKLSADRKLKESEERFRQMADNAPVMVWVTDVAGRCIYRNRYWYELTGQTEAEALGRGWLDAVHIDDKSAAELGHRQASEQQRSFTHEFRLRRSDGEHSWCINTASPRVGTNGEFLGLIGSVMDITDRKATEEALRAARDTFRNLVDRSPFGVYAVDADLRLVQASEGARRVFQNVQPLIGRNLAEVLRTVWREPFATQATERFLEVLATGKPYHAQKSVKRRADTDVLETYDWQIERVALPDGRPGAVCHFYDLTERQAHQEKIEMLMREVNHRAKNMLALVNAVARQTAASGAEDFLDRFGARVRALSASQDLLIKTDWDGVDLVALIESQLLHFKDLVGKRIMLNGPIVDLSPRAAQTLGMAMHELATNAAKYGALSNDAGSIIISWGLIPDVDGCEFSMSWTERNGPRVIVPTRRGFGQRVAKAIVESDFAGHVTLEYPESGVIWSLRCAISAIGGSAPQKAGRQTEEITRSGAILIVEDDALLAHDLAESLAIAGHQIVGPASSVAEAQDLLRQHSVSLAILDINLANGTSEPIAQNLRAVGVPFISVSGYSRSQQPAIFHDSPSLSKPVDLPSLLQEIQKCIAPKS